MENPQGGDSDCFDALGTYTEVGKEVVDECAGHDHSVTFDPLSCTDTANHSDPASSYQSNSPPQNELLGDGLGCLPNPMDPDENDVGEGGEGDFGSASCRQARRHRAKTARTRFGLPVQDDTGNGHLPLQVENNIEELGKFLSLMQPRDVARAHEFGPTLKEYSVTGVPVDCGENWSREAIDAAIERGPHQSAATPEAVELFQEDIKYQVDAGFARIVDWDSIKDNPPPQLKISPVAVVPQTNRRDRIILDLSFPVRIGTEISLSSKCVGLSGHLCPSNPPVSCSCPCRVPHISQQV